ncbi:MAG: radical SAM protein [Anaerolineae bacterium]|nr:radical SAM protein [Anaerolineae bacterium]
MDEEFPAAYLALGPQELLHRAADAYERLRDCMLCGRACHVNRRAGETGSCRTGERARASSYFAHFGEEECLRGWRGSGTIFFSYCNLRCQYCQNYELSAEGQGEEVEPEDIARMMLELQEEGCHNINFVSPSHVVPQILAALAIAAQAGLHLPLVYNTGGYDAVETLRLLDGVIDIYMPDMKYGDPAVALQYSKIPGYPKVNRASVIEMHRQVGDLVIGADGLARRGLLIRHLVLPGGLAGTAEVMRFLARNVSRDTYVNIMSQYRPAYKAHNLPPLHRPLAAEEYRAAARMAEEAGLWRFDQRRSLQRSQQREEQGWLVWLAEL